MPLHGFNQRDIDLQMLIYTIWENEKDFLVLSNKSDNDF